MIKVMAIICFLSMGTEEITMCFTGAMPSVNKTVMEFKTFEKCKTFIKNSALYMTEDLKERNIAINFYCYKEQKQEGVKINGFSDI